MLRARLVACVASVGPWLVVPPAHAQSEDFAAARALFDAARELTRHGDYDAACPKFEAASKLYPGSGVLLNLGDCYEKLGKTASAWWEFGEAARAAARLGRPADEREARRRQADLEPRLSRLLLRVARRPRDLSIVRDETRIDAGALDTPIPVDPGVHALRAEAPGYVTWSTSVEVRAPGETVALDVVLEPLPEPSAPPPAKSLATPSPLLPTSAGDERSQPKPWSVQRYVGLTLGGAGLLTLGTSGVLALQARSEFDAARHETGDARHTDSRAAVHAGNAATATVVAGAVLVAAGAAVWVTASDSRVSIGVGPTRLSASYRF